MNNELLSVIIPCYNEEDSIPIFYAELLKIIRQIKNLDYEQIYVNDGSNDRTLDTIKSLLHKDARVKFISFSRNFGKESAIFAGLKASKGEYVVIMDADLQDPPSLLPEMLKAVKEDGYDSVATKRKDRKGEPPLRSFFAHLFYFCINKISKIEIIDGARDYRLMKRKMVDAIMSLCEYNRFSKGIFSWVGFKTKWLEFENIERVAGKTKWSFRKLFLYSIEGIVSFSTAPLAVASVIGMLFFIISLLSLIFIFIRALLWGDPVAGWPSTICIVMFLGSIQLFSTGIMGLYLSRTYLETKKRPIFIIDEQNIS